MKDVKSCQTEGLILTEHESVYYTIPTPYILKEVPTLRIVPVLVWPFIV